MPAYNEARHIIAHLRDTIATMKSFGMPFEIIVVDDGSRDGTWAEALSAKVGGLPFVRVLRSGRNRGKGDALARGTRHARGDFVVFLDADSDLHSRQIPQLFAVLQRENADAVIGSKLHRQSKVDSPYHRRILSLGYYGLTRLLFGLPLRDTQTGLKLFRADVLHAVLPRVCATGWAFDLEVLVVAQSLGYKLCDAPVRLQFARAASRIRLSDVMSALHETLAIYFRQRARRGTRERRQTPRPARRRTLSRSA